MLTEAAMVLAAVLQLGGDPEEVNNPPSSEGFRNETRSEAVYPGVSGGLEVVSPFLTEAEINLDGRLDEEAFGFREFTLQADGLFEKVSYRFRM